jgi:hypothetical protein
MQNDENPLSNLKNLAIVHQVRRHELNYSNG